MFHLTKGQLRTKAIQVILTNKKNKTKNWTKWMYQKFKWYDILVADAKKCRRQQHLRQQRASDDQIMHNTAYMMSQEMCKRRKVIII